MIKTLKLTKKELREPMMMTWGRIHVAIYQLSNETSVKRLKALIEKFNKDLKKAKLEENFFKSPKFMEIYDAQTRYSKAEDGLPKRIQEKSEWD